jgi:hypothetical protein
MPVPAAFAAHIFSENRFPVFRIMRWPLTAAADARFMAWNLPACGLIPLL